MIISTQQSMSTCVIACVCGTTLFVTDASGVNKDERSASFVQNEVQAPVTLMPREGVPDEDVYQYRATAPQEAVVEEGAARYLETEFLLKRGIETYGWLDIGIGANNWGAAWNGPITFNDRAWQGQMNQLYLVNERILDDEDLSWGGRVDLLYGTDFLFTVAAGLDAYRTYPDPVGLSGPRWASSRYYGLAMPQLYGELGSQAVNVKFGHFYTLIGYEVVPAIGNFFYTHAYTMQYGEPFTHTGVLGTWVPNDQLTIIGGITNGWDNWDNGLQTGRTIANPGYANFNSNASFLGSITFSSSDGSQALTIANSSGNQLAAESIVVSNQAFVGNLSITSIVYSNEFTDRLTYVYQSDFGYQAYAGGDEPFFYETQGQQPDSAYWYGVNQYLFYNFTDVLIGGLRFEWFRDNNGTRVQYGLRDGSPELGGFAGNFWAMTWGLNYLVGDNLVIRPELRYDWFS
ncbi:MAG: outer membrane beta-barrel protein, partial [Pirellulales bacterium]